MSETIAIFIDGDNAHHRDVGVVMNEVHSYGRTVISRVYADWSCDNVKPWLEAATNSGIIPIQCDRIKGKNSTDIKLAVDIMKTLYSQPNISLYYIVTSDSDYRHVVSEIKIQNKKIHCIGSENANQSLKALCDTYTKIEVLRQTKKSPKSSSSKKKRQKLPLQQKKLYQREMENLLDSCSEINISLFKDTLHRKYQFDYREYGYQKMSDFMSDNFKKTFDISNGKRGCFCSKSDK